MSELLRRAAAESPDALALKTPEESISYCDLLTAAEEKGEELRAAGIDPGSMVATLLPNGVEWLIAYWGATLHNCVVAPLSTRAPRAEIDQLLDHAAASVLITSGELHKLEPNATPQIPPAKEPNQSDAVHLIQFTSGSTGEPKGAMLTHRGLLSAAWHHVDQWGLQPSAAVFVPNPLNHILGLMYGVLTPTAARATVLTLERFDLEAAVRLLREGRAVAMAGAPTHLQMISQFVDEHQLELPHLRLGFTGGAPIAPDWVERIRRSLGLEALINGYGMSEVGSIAQTVIGDSAEQVAHSIGYLAPGLEARIIDPDSRENLGEGEVGELWIRGPSVMVGYLGNESLSAEALDEDGWLRTGDLVRRDGAGRLFYVDRLGEMFTVGGFNVYPTEVERALRRCPGIDQVAVVPKPDTRLGSVPIAFVVAREAIGGAAFDEAAIRRQCEAELRNYAVPKRVLEVESLPLNRSGKVDKLRLRQRAIEIDVD